MCPFPWFKFQISLSKFSIIFNYPCLIKEEMTADNMINIHVIQLSIKIYRRFGDLLHIPVSMSVAK